MKKILMVLMLICIFFTLTACGSDNKEESQKGNDISQQEKKEEQKKEDNNTVIDDEIIDFDDEDNPPVVGGTVNVEEIINCDNCVFAYFSDTKKIGSTITDYTTDITTLKTSGGKQRHNFFGLVLSGNTISRAYSCILKDNKIYCIEGSTNGAYHSSNIGILNQVFTADQCKTISDGHNYWCSDGSYNGNTKTSGYTSLHYETSCTIYGSDARTGELACN